MPGRNWSDMFSMLNNHVLGLSSPEERLRAPSGLEGVLASSGLSRGETCLGARMALYDCAVKHAREHASFGKYMLASPTGLGKTVCSAAWAITAAERLGLKRILVFTPFISVTRQSAGVYSQIFGSAAVVEYHSMSAPSSGCGLEFESESVQFHVSTTVRFLDSLFGSSATDLSRLASFRDSVVLLDEIHAIPIKFRRVLSSLLGGLAHGFRTVVLASTATPHYGKNDGFEPIIPPKSLTALHAKCERARLFCLDGEISRDAVADLALDVAKKKTTCIVVVNTTEQARDLAVRIGAKSPGQVLVTHVSGRLLKKDIRRKLEETRMRLKDASASTILVCTKVVEAGADLSFGGGVRIVAGVESLLQLLGRINRHGGAEELGTLHVVRIDGAGGGMPEVEAGIAAFEAALAEMIEHGAARLSGNGYEIDDGVALLDKYNEHMKKSSFYKEASEYPISGSSMVKEVSGETFETEAEENKSYRRRYKFISENYSAFEKFGKNVFCIVDDVSAETVRRMRDGEEYDEEIFNEYLVSIPEREFEKMLESGTAEKEDIDFGVGGTMTLLSSTCYDAEYGLFHESERSIFMGR